MVFVVRFLVLGVVGGSLLVVRCSLFVCWCLLCIVCFLVVCCVLFVVVGLLLFDAWCTLFVVVRCVSSLSFLRVVIRCCVMFVVCW